VLGSEIDDGQQPAAVLGCGARAGHGDRLADRVARFEYVLQMSPRVGVDLDDTVRGIGA
jgi:hypothetical protein